MLIRKQADQQTRGLPRNTHCAIYFVAMTFRPVVDTFKLSPIPMGYKVGGRHRLAERNDLSKLFKST